MLYRILIHAPTFEVVMASHHGGQCPRYPRRRQLEGWIDCSGEDRCSRDAVYWSCCAYMDGAKAILPVNVGERVCEGDRDAYGALLSCIRTTIIITYIPQPCEQVQARAYAGWLIPSLQSRLQLSAMPCYRQQRRPRLPQLYFFQAATASL